MVVTANSIYEKENIDGRADLIAYLESHPNDEFHLSPTGLDLLGADQVGRFDHITQEIPQADIVVFLRSDADTPYCWLANRRGLYELISGPFLVNIDYYPSWVDPQFIVAADAAQLRHYGVTDCPPVE
jgi:hypothetical protein